MSDDEGCREGSESNGNGGGCQREPWFPCGQMKSVYKCRIVCPFKVSSFALEGSSGHCNVVFSNDHFAPCHSSQECTWYVLRNEGNNTINGIWILLSTMSVYRTSEGDSILLLLLALPARQQHHHCAFWNGNNVISFTTLWEHHTEHPRRRGHAKDQ